MIFIERYTKKVGLVMLVAILALQFGVSPVMGQADPDISYNQAKLSYKMRKLDRCLEQCNQTIEIDPTHYDALLLKGLVYYDREEYEEAVKWATKSIEIYNRNGEAFFERGLMYYYMDKYEEAAADFTAAAKIEIKRADYFYFKGLALKETGDMYEACKAWTKADKLGIDEDIEKLKQENCQNVQKPAKKK